jgi:membrane protein
MNKLLNWLKKIVLLHWNAGMNMVKHDGVEHAGYMAFITLLSFFPFMIFLMAVAGLLGKLDNGRDFIYLLISSMPTDLIQAIKPRIDEIILFPPTSLVTLSVFGIIWTSSSLVEGIRTILNKVYHVASPPAYIWRRLLSILQFFIITAVLLVSMILLLFLPAMYEFLLEFKSMKPVIDMFNQLNGGMLMPIWENVRQFTFAATLFFGVMFLYYGIPNVKLKMKSLIPGALEVVILWMISGSFLSNYIYAFTQLNVVYGSLAGFIITLLFFYIIHILFIYGAELNALIRLGENRELQRRN